MRATSLRNERGVTLVELLIALLVLSFGVLALVRMFPTATRNQLQDRMTTSANLYAQEKIEDLATKDWNGADLTVGRHPASASLDEALGSGQWHRFWNVTLMAAPLDNLKKVEVTVYWTYMGSRSITATTYLRR